MTIQCDWAYYVLRGLANVKYNIHSPTENRNFTKIPFISRAFGTTKKAEKQRILT